MSSKIFLLFVFALIMAGCLSGPLPEDILKSPAPTATITPAPSIESLNFISFDAVLLSEQDSELNKLSPEIEGLVSLPYTSPFDSVSIDLDVLNHPQRLQILASSEKPYTRLYVRPQKETDTIVYFSVYKMNDSKAASDVLEAYRGAWNKRALNISDFQIWIWDGYIEEIGGVGRPLSKDHIIYWDPETRTSFDRGEILENQLALTKAGATLYSVHGEAAFGPYFIKTDVKGELLDIQNRTDTIFLQVAKDILTNDAYFEGEPPLPIVDTIVTEPPVSDNETPSAERIREDLRELLENFLSGNISKEEYDLLFEQYNAELNKIENSS